MIVVLAGLSVFLAAAAPSEEGGTVADTQGWPAWNPGYSKARLDGPLAAGATGEVTLSRQGCQ